MKSDRFHVRHRRQAFLTLSVVALVVMVSYTIVHYLEGAMWAMQINGSMALFTTASILALRAGARERTAYRLFCATVGIGLFAVAALGPDHLYYHLALPLAFYFLLGPREGSVWSGGILVGLLYMLFAMEIPNTHIQETANVLRFLSSYVFVVIVAWGYGRLQERFYAVLETRNEQLHQEKEQLTATLKRMGEAESRLERTNIELEKTMGELREQGELMEAMFNSVSDGVVVTDTDGEFLFVNPSAENMVGMGATDAPSDEWSETYGTYYPDGETLFPSGDLPLARAMRGESVDDVEVLIRNRERPDGVNISINARPLQDDAGALKGGMIVLRDITALKKTEAELRQTVRSLRDQTRLMETIFNSISDGVVAADENGEFTVFNTSAERIAGIGSTDRRADEWSDHYGIFFPDRETTFPAEELPLVRAIAGEPSDEVEIFLRNSGVPDGVYLSVSGRPLQDDSGTTRGGVIVFRDVTERMLAEEALVQAFAQGRLEMVDTILHNIGNAINSVAAGVRTIAEQLAANELVSRLSALGRSIEAHRDDWIPYLKDDPQGQKVLPFILALADDFSRENARLQETTSRVRDRVDHIVNIIRTERSFESRDAMTRKDIDLRRAIVDTVRLLQEPLTQRGIRVDIDCDRAPKEIRIQESRFHQMLVNLTKNAMEAIDELVESGGLEGEPRIRIQACVRGEFLVLEVTDNGVGIAAENPRILFAAGYTTKDGGSGLGLHSTANFVIGSGGRIRVLSDGVGKGATIRVELRLSSVVQPSHRQAAGRSRS